MQCTNLSLTPNWNIVTNYYYAFFCASLFLRLCHRGNIFLENERKKTIEKTVSEIVGDTNVSLDSNMFYSIEKNDPGYILRLSKSEANTHEVVWKKLNELIKELHDNSKKGTDEYTILNNIITVNSKIGATYPSMLRNKVNYQPLFGLECIEKKIHIVNPTTDWSGFFLVSGEHLSKNSSIDSHTEAMFAYTMYIEHFCFNLMCEYFERQGRENGLLKRINKYREEKIIMPELRISF